MTLRSRWDLDLLPEYIQTYSNKLVLCLSTVFFGILGFTAESPWHRGGGEKSGYDVFTTLSALPGVRGEPAKIRYHCCGEGGGRFP